jgi:type VI secretion system secreted protein VgrG
VVSSDCRLHVGGNLHEEAGGAIYIKAVSKIVIEAGMQISLKVGGNHVTIDPTGVTIVGAIVKINSGGAAGSGTAVVKQNPKKAKKAVEAKDATGGQVESAKGMGHAGNPQTWRSTTVPDIAAQNGAPFYGGGAAGGGGGGGGASGGAGGGGDGAGGGS